MKIDIFSKHIELNAALRGFIESKIGALEKYLPTEQPAVRVEISKPSSHHRSGEIFYAEGNLKLGRNLLRAEAQDADLHAAITVVRDELQAQIKKFKDKKLAARR
ncbi:MAG TPA: ribosome-associated translation inhibitor RaiA [Candidatus Paceibacterota bacterium]|nr:ribosome-associated translation inhibitor RaiA [Candidatus Paceibacterota bacterium]